ncbi:putative F-box domain-containing protein [Medicago truncatula]|uniref:F-box protein SKIP2 n=2 Tax=Medicago truncatula TaxID=3880 RepID=G7L2N3_MEDTR|nr:F-box protein SKIP2 [Medicago truncatula]RHN47571.1 putative F-box domain-containing protein [Medicago truncatula]
MSSLPEELWSRILEIGIEKSSLSYKDLCCISISCHLLHRLSSDDSLWNGLISSDFPSSSASSLASSSKSLYKLRLEREKERLSHMARITYHYISCHNQSFNDRLCRWSRRESITVHETEEVLSSVGGKRETTKIA